MRTPTKYIVNRKKQHNRAVTLEIRLFLAIAIVVFTTAYLSFYYCCKFLVMIGGWNIMTTKKFEQLYKTVKTELQLECSNIRYFNKLFFKQILQAIQSDNYTEIFTTDLYNKNGCTYCALLGILNNLTDEVIW